MSLNSSSTPDGRGVLIYNGEIILLYTKHTEMSFSGNHDVAFKGTKDGALYLTSHRIIFINGKPGNALRSFALPFFALQDVKLEQPLLGSNYLKGIIQALPGGNFNDEVKWKLSFPKGGCIDFGHALLQAVAMAARNRPSQAPPAYGCMPTSQTFYAAQAKSYTAPEASYYGFQAPTHVFPDRPREGEVFVYDAPPPYPGIGPLPAYSSTASAPALYQNVPGPSAPDYPRQPQPQPPMGFSQGGAPPPYPAGPSPPYPGYAQAGPLPQKN